MAGFDDKAKKRIARATIDVERKLQNRPMLPSQRFSGFSTDELTACRFTSDMGNDGTCKCILKRWNDDAESPSGCYSDDTDLGEVTAWDTLGIYYDLTSGTKGWVRPKPSANGLIWEIMIAGC